LQQQARQVEMKGSRAPSESNSELLHRVDRIALSVTSIVIVVVWAAWCRYFGQHKLAAARP